MTRIEYLLRRETALLKELADALAKNETLSYQVGALEAQMAEIAKGEEWRTAFENGVKAAEAVMGEDARRWHALAIDLASRIDQRMYGTSGHSFFCIDRDSPVCTCGTDELLTKVQEMERRSEP